MHYSFGTMILKLAINTSGGWQVKKSQYKLVLFTGNGGLST